MDISGTQKTTLPETPRETKTETPKTTGTPGSSTLRDINLLSPGRDCCSSLSISSKSVTT